MRTTLVCLALALAFSPVRADTLEIVLPGLQGDYAAGTVLPNAAPTSRIVTFAVPAEVVGINALRMKISGSGTDGAYIIERQLGGGITVRDTLPTPAAMRMILTAPTLGERYFWGSVAFRAPTATDAVASLEADPGAWLDPGLLLGTTVTAEMICWLVPPGTPYIDPLATLTAVSVVLEADVVPAERRLWGEIKALYR